MTTISTKFEMKMGVATREAYGQALAELGRTNPSLIVLDADLAKSTFSATFAKEFPDRFFSVGIAEANMVGIAGGLALAGKLPFASSFAVFLCDKGYDQLRMCAAYPHVNAKFVGSHGGISIGEDGPSQQSVEDFALACALPGFTVLCPADEFSTRALVKQMAELVGPCYMRTGRAKAPIIYSAADTFQIGRAKLHGIGRDVAIVACGFEVGYALQAQAQLQEEGIAARVLDMHTLKPLDHEAIALAASECGAIVTAEEHLLDGGLGSRVARSAAMSRPVPIEFVGINNTYSESATPEQLMEKYGLAAPYIVEAAKKVVKRK
ncbi:MAG TPA: transketolase C-terminal domain-containing protein [Clostridia bacterium]|nr:transketolase C-terminal domain-containing protein [Clostridia bacterium]